MVLYVAIMNNYANIDTIKIVIVAFLYLSMIAAILIIGFIVF